MPIFPSPPWTKPELEITYVVTLYYKPPSSPVTIKWLRWRRIFSKVCKKATRLT